MTGIYYRRSSHEIASMLSVMDRRQWTWIIIFFHWISYQAGQGCYNEASLVLPHLTVCSKATIVRSHLNFTSLEDASSASDHSLLLTTNNRLFWSMSRTRSNSIVFLIVWNRNARIEKLKSTRTKSKWVAKSASSSTTQASNVSTTSPTKKNYS